jgi:hypothetical protein
MSGPACMHSINSMSPKINNYVTFNYPEIYKIQTDNL